MITCYKKLIYIYRKVDNLQVIFSLFRLSNIYIAPYHLKLKLVSAHDNVKNSWKGHFQLCLAKLCAHENVKHKWKGQISYFDMPKSIITLLEMEWIIRLCFRTSNQRNWVYFWCIDLLRRLLWFLGEITMLNIGIASFFRWEFGYAKRKWKVCHPCSTSRKLSFFFVTFGAICRSLLHHQWILEHFGLITSL